MSSTVLLLLLLFTGCSLTVSKDSASTNVMDLFLNALIKTIQTPISLNEANAKLSVEIILANDVFTLDDILRLFIQQFILALYDDRHHLVPDDWETLYPAYSKVINELNKVLELIGQRTLSKINMKDLRPFIKSFTPKALADLQRLIKTLDDLSKEETNSESKIDNSISDEL